MKKYKINYKLLKPIYKQDGRTIDHMESIAEGISEVEATDSIDAIKVAKDSYKGRFHFGVTNVELIR